jgi:exopolysaccharide biosynthesis WecB/TagA/CpsF family protein
MALAEASVVKPAIVPRWDILGIAVLAGRGGDVTRELDWRLASGEYIKLTFLNAHASNVAARDGGFLEALKSFTVLNDGVGVDIAARMLEGKSFPENLNGTDFTLRYLRETSRHFRIFLLGAKPGVAEDAALILETLLPQHLVVGTRDGYFVAAGADEVVAEIKASGADLLLVAMGNPAQELWIDTHLAGTGCRMAMGVGALLDFLAERVPRAPRVIQRIRLEWAFRLALEPRRLWRRYLIGNPVFLVRVAREIPRRRANGHVAAAQELRRET